MIPDAETWMGTMGIIFVVALFALIAWLVRSIVLKGMDLQQARADRARLQDYQQLAEAATTAEANVATELKRLTGIEQRLAEIERMLREVDDPQPARR